MRIFFKILSLLVAAMLIAPFGTIPSVFAQTAGDTCLDWKISGTRKSDGIFSEIVVPVNFLFPYEDPEVPPAIGSPDFEYYKRIFTFPIFACNRRVSPVAPAPISTGETPSTANAVKQCTVDAAVDQIGDKALGAVKDLGKGAVKLLGKELGIKNLASLGLDLAIPGLGSALSGIGDALGLGDIFGGGGGGPQQVEETGKQLKETEKIQFGNCMKAIKDEAFKIALGKFRKRLLDRMTDDIVGWISDGRDPKFITNFGDFLEEAGQAAVGDTARELGLAELCSPLRARIPPLLAPIPKFSESASCTLDDIVENIQGFYDDFSAGGPLAYAESFSPNNNFAGSLFATQDEVMRQTAKKKGEAALLASAGGGYKPVVQCLEWTATSFALTLSGRSKETRRAVNSSDFDYPNPLFPPASGSAAYESVASALGGGSVVFTCSREEITIPPAGTQQIAGVALIADTQHLASANDLSKYSNAVFDAAINRIIKEGVKGLRGSPTRLRSETTTGRAPTQYTDADPFSGYGSEFTSSTNFTAQLKTEIRRQIPDIRTKVASASTTLTRLIALNKELIATSTALSVDCEIPHNINSGAACGSTSSTLILAQIRSVQFTTNRTNLTKTLEGTADIEREFNANSNLLESELQSFVSALGTTQSYLATTIVSQLELETLLTQQLTTTGQARQACQLGSYSCSWTPPPSS
ncbi:MAG: hypothetical protein V1885_02920 [Candidatus Brennerbacteria bacterium]